MRERLKSNLIICSLLLILLSGNSFGQTWEIFDQEYKLVRKIQNGNLNILGNALRINTGNQQLSLLSQEYESFITIDDTQVYQYLEPWVIVYSNGKFGALHEYGDLVYRTEYERIESYFNLLLGQKGPMFTIYDRGTKQTLTVGPFDSAKFALNGQLIAKTPQGYYLPLSDEPDRIYEELHDVNEDVIVSKEHTGYGLINRDGKYILDPIIDIIEYLGDNHFYAHDGNQHMLIKAQTNNADIKYTSYHRIAREENALVEYIHGKLRRVMKNDGILLDAVGMTTIQKVSSSHYNIAFRDEKLGLLNPNGSWDVQPTLHLQWLQPGNQGLFGAKIKDKYGYVNAQGQVVIPPQFEGVKKFSEGMAGVKRDGGGWGYINLKGEELISAQFDEVGDFFRGFAIVKKGGKSTIINKDGDSVLKDAYDRICLTDDNYYLTENGGKYGMVNPIGQEITLPIFDDIRREEYDKILVRLQGRYGVINEKGEISLPLYYDRILFDPITKKILAKHNGPLHIDVAENTTRKKKKKGA
jgi:hypothetical protein